MTTLLIEHNVRDFGTWKAAFDAHSSVRATHRISGIQIYQRWDNPNAVCILCSGAPADIDAFVADPKLKEAMASAGVQGAPSIRIMDERRVGVPAI